MIEIVINGYSLPLPKGFRLNREVETQIFNKEMSAYDFTYPIEVPLTDEARAALGFPDVIARSEHQATYPGKLIIDSIFVSGVTITVLSVNQIANTCRLSVLGQYRSLREVFGNKRVCDLDMGGLEFIERHIEPGFDPYEYLFTESSLHIKDGLYNYNKLKIVYRGGKVNCFMTALAKGIIERPYLFPKAVDLRGDVPGNSGGVSVINAWDFERDRYVDADFYNAMATDWEYMPDINPSNPFANNQRHFWVPMFRLVKVLNAIFSESGIFVEGDLFSDPKAQDIVLYNTHAINIGVQISIAFDIPTGEWLTTLTAGRGLAYIIPGNHLPKMEIVDFLYALGKRYNLQFEFDPLNSSVRILEDRQLIENSPQVLDITTVTTPKGLVTRKSEVSYFNGYQFKFEQDSANSEFSTDVKDDFEGRTVAGSINHLGATPSFPLSTEDLVYVRNENAYYRYLGSGEYALFSHNLGAYSTGSSNNLQQVMTSVISPPMMVQVVKRIKYFSGYGRVLNLVGVYDELDGQAVPFSHIGMSFDEYHYIDWDETNGNTYSPGVGHPWRPHFFQTRKLPISHLPVLVSCLGFKKGIVGIDDEYFMATSGAFDNRGIGITPYRGCWSAPAANGLYEEWWQRFAQYVQDSILVEYDVLLSAELYNKLKISSGKFKIDGLHFLIKKANFIMPFPERSTIQFVKVK